MTKIYTPAVTTKHTWRDVLKSFPTMWRDPRVGILNVLLLVIMLTFITAAFSSFVGILAGLAYFYKTPELHDDLTTLQIMFLTLGIIGIMPLMLWVAFHAFDTVRFEMHKFWIIQGWHKHTPCEVVTVDDVNDPSDD